VKDDETFTCFVFWGGGNRLALPADEVFQVDEPGVDAPTIESILSLRPRDTETCLLRLGGSGEFSLPIVVGGPIDILVFDVSQVLLNSATHGGPLIQAIVEQADELILLLDAEAVKSELIQRSNL
jgi:hypothetical protein